MVDWRWSSQARVGQAQPQLCIAVNLMQEGSLQHMISMLWIIYMWMGMTLKPEVGWAESYFDWLKQQSMYLLQMQEGFLYGVDAGPRSLTQRVRWPRDLGLHCWNISHCSMCTMWIHCWKVFHGYMANKGIHLELYFFGTTFYTTALKPKVGWAMLLWTIMGTFICSGGIYLGHATG